MLRLKLAFPSMSRSAYGRALPEQSFIMSAGGVSVGAYVGDKLITPFINAAAVEYGVRITVDVSKEIVVNGV